MRPVRVSHLVLLSGVLLLLVWSAWKPRDYFTWWLEVTPALLALVILSVSYRRFRFTTLVYTLIALHMAILFIGGHYTYALTPLGDWVRPIFGWTRNNFDRLGHIAQGFVPAMVAREVFIRLEIVKRKGWQPFLIVCLCLAISAFYELIEWWAALVSGDSAMAFLATQGDPWDTQKDMFLTLSAAVGALLLLSRAHDRALQCEPK
jgi:putative membrane protein